MKIVKAQMLLKKAAAMCKSKTSFLTGRLLILTALQRRRMAAVAVISHKIQALVVADRHRVYCNKDLSMRKIEKRPAVLHGGGMAVDLFHQLALFDQEDGHGCRPDWTFMHPLFNDDVDDNCCYTNDDDVLPDTYDADDDEEEEPSVMDVITSMREIDGFEFHIEEDIDEAADMFIRTFRHRMNQGF